MNELALFAGAGGGILASKLLGWNTICAVEIEKYPRDVLLARQRDGQLERFPIWDDVRTFDGKPWRDKVDIITGGFPCQAFSSAARGRNIASKNLWQHMRRIVGEIRPALVFAENVAEKAVHSAGESLAEFGYEFRYTNLSAKDLGADHVRDRYWLLAYTDSYRKFRSTVNAKTPILPQFCNRVWATYPSELRMDDGLAHRVDRIKALGNGQVPLVAATAFKLLSEGLI